MDASSRLARDFRRSALARDALAEKAGREGIRCFTGAVLGENLRMFGLVRSVFERVGYATR